MKNSSKVTVVLLASLFALVGCDATITKPKPAPETITISSDGGTHEVPVRDTLQLHASVLPLDAVQDVTWRSSNSEVGTISSDGLFSALTIGETTITARSEINSNIQNTFTINVTERPVLPPQSISLFTTNNIHDINPNQSAQVYFKVLPEDALQDVVFTVSNEHGEISDSGLFKALSLGQVSVIAKAKADESITQTYSFNVTEEPIDIYKYMTSIELTKVMGMGFNYGNALENSLNGYPSSDYANNIVKELGFVTSDGNADREDFIEARQGQPEYRGRCTANTIKAIYDRGFRTIRLPIAYSEHCDAQGKILERWFTKIETILDYCQPYSDLFVIIPFMDVGQFRKATLDPTNEESSKKYFHSIWSQVAERFKKYDSRLIFESINEPLYNDVWSPVITSDKYIKAIEILEYFNQDLVDICRDGVSNNNDRFLMITSYGCMANHAYNGIFNFPIDKADHKLLLSIHNYNPTNFTHVRGGSKKTLTYDDSVYGPQIEKSFEEVEDKIINKLEIGVVLGEWGSSYLQAEKQSKYGISLNENISDRETYAYRMVSEAIKHRCVPVVWDNSKISQEDDWCESFSFLNRHKASGLYDKMTNLSGVKYDNEHLWLFESVLGAMFRAYQEFSK